MYFSVALCDLVGRMYCSTFSVVPGTSCCPVMLIGGIPRLLMAVAQALGSDMGIVMELETMVMLRFPSGERHTKGMRKWDLKFPFFRGSLFKCCKKMCIYLDRLKESPRSKTELHFRGVRSLASFYDKIPEPYWHERFVISKLILILPRATGERGGERPVWPCIQFDSVSTFTTLFIKLSVQLPLRGSTARPLGTSCLPDPSSRLKRLQLPRL